MISCSYHVTFMMMVNNPAAIILLGVAVAHADWGTAKELPCRVEEFDSQICKCFWCCCIYNSLFVVSLACSVGFLLLCSVPCSFPLSAMTWAMICWKTTSFSSKLIFFLKDTSSSAEEVYNQKSMQQNHTRGEERRGEKRREEKREGKQTKTNWLKCEWGCCHQVAKSTYENWTRVV